LTDPGERGLRPRRRSNAVDDVIRLRIDEHLEQLFARLRMVRQRAIRVAESCVVPVAADRVEVNLAAPNPLPNADFMRILRESCGIPFGLAANRWMLEIGACFMRTETELILKSRRVVPARLLEHGFTFTYPERRSAARALARAPR
jgi:Domain of unknown function (DUF1731)